MITFTEFEKTVYFTETKIVLPLVNLKLERSEYIIKRNNQIDFTKLKERLHLIYDEKLNKLIN